MKYIKIWLIAATMVAISAVSFTAGRNYEAKFHSADKDYQAACMLSDICHFALDNIEEFDEIYYDYIDNIDCDSNAVITREEIQKYAWCY